MDYGRLLSAGLMFPDLILVVLLPVAVQSQSHLFKMFISFLKERERQRASGGGAEREGDTESEAASRLRAVSTEHNEGLEPTNSEIMT